MQQSIDCEEILTGSLRRITGLGVTVTEIYPEGRPYLKGFFNALEAWRGWRDVDSWKLQQTLDSLRDLDARGATIEECKEAYPEHVGITDELVSHVRGLLQLFDSEEPRAVPVRPTNRGEVRYHVGDASAEGFAAGIQYPDLRFEGRDGLWRNWSRALKFRLDYVRRTRKLYHVNVSELLSWLQNFLQSKCEPYLWT